MLVTTRRNTPGRSATAVLPSPQNKSTNSPSRKKRNRTRRNRQRGRLAGLPAGNQLSECAKAYAKVQFDPFNTRFENELPCIPDQQDVPSMKFSTFQRGNFNVGTEGYGFIVISPYALGNDIPNIAYSNNTYAGSTITNNSATTGVIHQNNLRFPFSSAAMPACRVVASAIRIRYSGTELQRGGLIIGCATLDASSTDNIIGRNLSDLSSRPESGSFTVTRSWKGLGFRPSQIPVYNSATNTIATNGNGKMGFIVYGEDALPYEYEVINYYEAVSSAGNNFITNTSRSHSDMVGLSWVRDFAGSVASSEIGTAVLQRFGRYIQNAAVSSLSYAAPLLYQAGRSRAQLALEL